MSGPTFFSNPHALLAATIGSLAALVGCASEASVTRPPAPARGEAPAASAAEPAYALPLPSANATVPAPPAACGAYDAPKPRVPGPECADSMTRNRALVTALGQRDPARRDALLLALESCPAFAEGLLRALRADLVDERCADTIVRTYHPRGGRAPRKDVEDALLGLAYAARLSRLVREPPKLEPPYDRAHFKEFFDGRLVPWIQSQAEAIQQLSLAGSKLSGYGKGVAAIAAGMADLRFVDVVRNVALPAELAQDAEVRDTYYVALDQALEPRKARGRDAALVGLREFASIGSLRDARVDAARRALSVLYAGRRIDALDALLLPELPALGPQSDEERLALTLPTFYSEFFLRGADLTSPALFRALIERGLPAGARASLAASQALPAEMREMYARALVDSGRRYWRAADFSSVLALPADGKSDVESLLDAIATALAHGPRDAADMMLSGPVLPPEFANVTALDAIANSKGAFAGLAAYDAAVISSLAPPDPPDRAFFKALAARYRRAAEILRDADQRRRALEAVKAADDTARAVQPSHSK